MAHTTKATLKSRIIAGLLAVLMIAGIFGTWPVAIFAEEQGEDQTVDVWDGSIANGFGGGNGSANDPYQIHTGAQLAYLAYTTNKGTTYSGKYFKLMNDIDLNGIEWTPIGTHSNKFMGSFDGGYHEISNMGIHDCNLNAIGLFGGVEGSIENLAVIGFYISGTFTGLSYYSIGAVAGWSKGNIKNCYAFGSIEVSVASSDTFSRVGLLAGQILGKATNCFAYGVVAVDANKTEAYVGGFVGFINDGVVQNAYSVAQIAAYGSKVYVGGFAGSNGHSNYTSGSISNSFAVSYIESEYRYGNFVGTSNGTENTCYYYTEEATGTQYNTRGIDAKEIEVFMSQDWITATLGWNFESVWETGLDYGYPLPILAGFGGFAGMESPEEPEKCEHAYGVTDRVDATCTMSGYVRYTCNNCGDWYEEVTSAFGHKYEKGVCVVCGESAQYVPVAQLGYKSNAEALEEGKIIYLDLWALWAAEGYVDEDGNECPQWVAYNDETVYSTPDGNDGISGKLIWDAYANVLDVGGYYEAYVAILVQDACNHDFVQYEVVEPTCTTDGFVHYICTECGESRNEQLVALGHVINNDVCERCGEVFEAPKADMWDGTVADSFGGGNGTEYDPYQIYTGAQLAYLAYSTNSGTSYNGKYFVLMNNIDLCGIEWTPIGVGSTPESSKYAFDGNFNGNGMIISGLTTTASRQFAGLFGILYNASVSNLGVKDAYVYSVYSNNFCTVGGLVGTATNSKIVNCYVSDSVIYGKSGGLSAVGGLAGRLFCTGNTMEVINCFANNEVTGNGSGNSCAGGLVGIIDWDGGSNVYKIDSCYTAGTVYSNCATGGLVGLLWSDIVYINNSFSCAQILGGSPTGAFIGRRGTATLYVQNCYYASGQSNSVGTVTVTSVDDFKSYEWISSNLGWDFESVWTFDYNNGYELPVLQGFGVGGGDMHFHSYMESERVEPTCQNDGYIRYTCTECDYYYEEILPILAHSYTESERVEPTCQADGYIRYTCSMCGEYYDDTLYILEHQYTESERVEPTCQYEGYIRYTCSMCGDYYDDVLSTIRHTLDENNYCTMCGEHIDQRPADILIIEDDDAWDKNSNSKLMENLLAAGMINSYKIIRASAFSAEDLNAYSVLYIVMNDDVLSASQVNNMYDSALDFLNAGGTVIYGLAWHGQRSVTLPAGAVASYTDSGNYGYVVDSTHPIVTGELTDGVAFPNKTPGNRLSHSYISIVPENANVILKNENSAPILVEYAYGRGNVILSCLTWECFYDQNYDNVVFANIAYDDLIVYAAAIAGSGVGNVHPHNYVESERVEPTCGGAGYIRYTCTECDRFYDETLPALEHQYTESERVEPTCQAYGYIRYTCTMCGDYYDDTLYILEHQYTETERVEPTCQAYGYIRYTCSMCGEYYDETLYALEHQYSESERVEPTCQYEGYIRYTCSMCGDYYDDVLSTIRHKVDENDYCTMCGEYIEPSKADLWDGTVAGGFGGGSGTENDPYQIYTGAELAYLAYSTNNGNAHHGEYFVLMNNIDLCGIEWTPIGKGILSSSHQCSPYFSGHFNGNGFAILNLSITQNNTSFAGLFGLTNGASICNLAIVGANVVNEVASGYRSKAGGLIGHATDTTVERCSVTDSKIYAIALTQPSSAGGLIGIVYGACTVSNCYVNAEVLSNGHVGGIVGGDYGSGSAIQNCYSSGRVIFGGVNNSGVSKRTGGIIGYTQSSVSITNCFTCVAIDLAVSGSESSQISGDSAKITNCYHSISGYFSRNTGTYVSVESFTSYEWISSTLGWDFESVWTFDYNNGYELPVLQGFGVGGGNVHAHNYVESERVEPTCQAYGYIRYTCTECDYYYEEILPILAHSYTESERVEPTCQAYGYIRYTCTICGDYYDETLYALEHQYNEGERVEPTCQHEGYIRYTCSMCGEYYDETLYALEHQYSESERVEPTCQYEGYIRYTCSMCGEYYDDVLTTVRHKLDDNNYCTMCGEYIEYVPANILVVQNSEPWGYGSNQMLMQNLLAAEKINSYKIVNASAFHYEDLNSYSVIYIVMNADTLTQDQVNGMYSKVIDFLNAGGTVIYGLCWYNQYAVTLPGGAVASYGSGHYGTIVDYDHPIMSGELTDGVRFPDRANGSALNHTYISTVPENANVILKDDNNHAILVEYNYGGGSVILSGLTWEHYYRSGSSFAYYSYDDLIVYAASLSGSGIGGGNGCKHSYSEVVVEPTCTTDGYTHYTCELCGYEFNGNYVSRWGHTIGEWIIDYEPTCTTSGRKHSECAVCGQQLENIYIASLGHNYVTIVTREVTCTTPGVLTHTCERCGSSYSTYVYSEHAYAITDQVQPTCYTDGYTVYTCSKCDDFYTEVIPGGHDYKSVITKVATSEEDGEITYTCESCGDYYTEIIPAREAANVLLIQDKYPWGENNNAALLNQMLNDGYITGWDLTTTSNFANVDLGLYNVILIANDQSTATYNQLNYLSDTLTQFASAGGVVIYGACDSGWSGGYINYSLPEGVVKKNFYSRYNYIVDGDHLIVSGILTDGKALTDTLLNGNYCSHSAFETNTLPAGANIILQDAHGDATLVEYAVGEGHIILSGLTWEFYYNRNCYDGRTNTSYTKNVYDDLVMYALYLSDPCEHIYDEGEIVEPTCTEDGYTKHTCQNCGATMKDNVTEALGHTEGEWAVTVEPTQYAEGLKELCCTVCGEVLKSEVLPPVGGAAARVESDLDYVVIGDTVVFTLVIENCDPIKSLSVVPVFDTDVFEIISAEWLLEDAMIQNIEEGTYKSVSVWSDFVDVNCAVYCITLRAKQFTDGTTVTFSLRVEDQEGVVTVVPKSVAVTECPHAQTRVEFIDEIYHANVCTLCGYAVMEEHVYDDDNDLECNACAYTRECPHSNIYVTDIDGTYHAYVCYTCGEMQYAEHTYGNAYDLDCNECGHVRECPHYETYITVIDDTYHAYVCYNCGSQEIVEHRYHDEYDLDCNDCGYERECPHAKTYVEIVDGVYHVHVCDYCGHTEKEEHTLDNGVCTDCGYMALVKGDVDNDEDVDSDDAVYLVYNVFFGDGDYPVKQSLDFDGDGRETTDDAIYLLYYIYFGAESYPLH